MAIPWRPVWHLKTWIKELQPHIVHVHHPFLLGPWAISIAQRMGIKTIFTYHTIYEAYAHYVPLPQWISKPIIVSLVIAFCKNINEIIVPSIGMKDYLHRHDIKNVSVIPSGLPSFFSAQSFVSKKIEKPWRLLYVGRFVKEKNISSLLQVMAMLPLDYHLTLIGYGNYSDYLQSYAYEDLCLSHQRVRFLINPPKEQLLDHYRKAHLFLFPSQTDTQGLVLAEAMACSTPVIALDGCGQRDIVYEGKNGFIANDTNHMSALIQKTLNNPAVYGILQQGAYQTAQRYGVSECVAGLLARYQRVSLKGLS
jgi:glycosyltransferase involved in cell wall biosynthesis